MLADPLLTALETLNGLTVFDDVTALKQVTADVSNKLANKAGIKFVVAAI